ncbi:MAG TPA: hypothetical protein VGO06_00630 [Bosea sp. (in: a-proteobacteria)]|jgi:hypothetical protein|uniref:hypothetical protein n=1 Tax=Bosea sp. (in: a-proteobacteria) TaxID=1871050 RepID=UPI002E111A1E|nr:hypothetical protein [Bosea sp. (in: a-proteobacteria)]
MRPAIVIAAALLFAGCQHQRPEPVVEIVERKVEVPPSLLSSMPEPKAKEVWTRQRDVALYLVKLAEAVEDCRVKLESVKMLLAQ